MSVSMRGSVGDAIDVEVGRKGNDRAERSWEGCPVTDSRGGGGWKGWWADGGGQPAPCGGSGPGAAQWSWGSCSSLLWQSGQV